MPNKTNSEGTNPVIRARGIEKSYSSTIPHYGQTVEVLTGTDFDLYPGEIVGVVGENGSGKSTLMKILVGTLNHDAGNVDRNGRIGWCPQETLLYDRLTVRETFDLFGRGYGMSESEVDDAVSRMAERLDFEEYVDYRVENLSGGNRQKVNLGIALMHDPDVLLLDEPYTGFDWETYLAFWELTEELVDSGTGIVIISHFVNEQDRFDRIYKLREGVLHEEGTDDE